jgi:hypothetical protein
LRPFLDWPALLRAIATACFCGFPAFISVRILAEMAFFDEPLRRGIGSDPLVLLTVALR